MIAKWLTWKICFNLHLVGDYPTNKWWGWDLNPGSLTLEPELWGLCLYPPGCSFSSLEEIVQMRAQIMKHRSDKSKGSCMNGEGGTGNGVWGSHTPGGLMLTFSPRSQSSYSRSQLRSGVSSTPRKKSTSNFFKRNFTWYFYVGGWRAGQGTHHSFPGQVTLDILK